MSNTETVKILNRAGVGEIIDRMDGLEEGTQTTQDFLVVTCLLAQTQGIEYESFIQLISQSWPMAGKIVDLQ